eukprot:TRINITY_DN12960_c0_g1_i1.p1 TRINITY_DN12960_c0_g1~~TRINITY_DN12960_c0_g1_i1.p1  ORF type:complete len:321 (+),score=90.21 TRINITY_DN12960_c0_g1_i1:109-1071(+)
MSRFVAHLRPRLGAASSTALRRFCTSATPQPKPTLSAKQMIYRGLISVGIGFTMGTIGGIAGLGGGVIAVPLLTNLLQLSQHQAIGTSLASVLGSGLFGAGGYWIHGNKTESVLLVPAAILAVGGMITSRFGAKMAATLPSHSIRKALAAFTLASSVIIIAEPRRYFQPQVDEKKIQKKLMPSSDGGIASEFVQDLKEMTPERFVFLSALGAVTGFSSGLFGVGGGIIMVPLLSCIFPQQQAVGTSLLALVLPCLVGTLTHYKMGNIALPFIAPIIIGAGIGSWFSSKFLIALEEKQKRMAGATIIFGISAHYWLKVLKR